ncbi:MAG: glycosyltransferase [Bacteroidia bacterium]
MSIWEWVFWIGAFIVGYTYVIYPTALIAVSQLKRRFSPEKYIPPDEWPEVTIVIPAYREAQSVKPKMESIRRLDYPQEKLRIVWVIATHEGDESFTPTVEAIQAYPEAEIIVVPHRGKIYSLNEARKHVKTELVLLTDADVVLSPSSLRQAVLHILQNPEIGIVGGTRQVITMDNLVGQNEASFLSFDKEIARAESDWGYAFGLWGGFLLLRKPLWPSMPAGVVDDLYINLYAGLSGKKVIIDSNIYSYEATSILPDIEFRRKSRIAYTAFHTLRALEWRNFLKYPLFTFFFLSHKFFRYLPSPLALVVTLLSAGILAIQNPFSGYGIAFLFQVLAWGEGLLLLRGALRRFPKGITLPGYFILAHWAQIVGFWKFLKGEDPLKVWQRLPRTEIQPSQI